MQIREERKRTPLSLTTVTRGLPYRYAHLMLIRPAGGQVKSDTLTISAAAQRQLQRQLRCLCGRLFSLATCVTGPTADHIQVSRADVQDPPHGDTCLPQPSHHSAHLWAHSTFLCSSAAVRTVPQDYFLETSFPLHCSYHLELSAEHCDSS